MRMNLVKKIFPSTYCSFSELPASSVHVSGGAVSRTGPNLARVTPAVLRPRAWWARDASEPVGVF